MRPFPPDQFLGSQPAGPSLVEPLFGSGRKVRASLVAHAEMIALAGVLEPEQAEAAKRKLWASLELPSLLDTEVQDRLHLSGTQRREVFDRLTERSRVRHLAVGATIHEENALTRDNSPNRAEKAAAIAETREASEMWMKESDREVLATLSRAQIRALGEILGKTSSAPVAKPR